MAFMTTSGISGSSGWMSSIFGLAGFLAADGGID